MKLSDQHLKEVCKIGQGNDCCRYLTVGVEGFSCSRHSSLKLYLDARAQSETMVAQGDNCDGQEGD